MRHIQNIETRVYGDYPFFCINFAAILIFASKHWYNKN